MASIMRKPSGEMAAKKAESLEISAAWLKM
jgi:hypothetical protein